MYLGKSMGLEVDDDDMEELLEGHKTELNTKNSKDLQGEQQEMAAEELSSREEEGREDILTSLIKELFGKWGEMKHFIEKYVSP